MEEKVNHPQHYHPGTYEAIKVIKAWNLGFCLGNVIKYISRAGRKTGSSALEDLKKAQWYLNSAIQDMEERDMPDEPQAIEPQAIESQDIESRAIDPEFPYSKSLQEYQSLSKPRL
jgi:hypothetical protein